LQANDATQSYAAKKIIKFSDSPPTIADGARSPAVSERTFYYLSQLDGFFEIPEHDIIYWTQWLMHLLKITVEPTSAVAMAGGVKCLKKQKSKKNKNQKKTKIKTKSVGFAIGWQYRP
jgi:threonine dehydratase